MGTSREGEHARLADFRGAEAAAILPTDYRHAAPLSQEGNHAR